MHVLSSFELLSAPWTAVTWFSKAILALQLFWVVVGLFPSARHRLRPVPWFGALIIGPPLLWVLTATSVGLLMWMDGYTHHSWMAGFIDWCLRVPIIIGTTAVLQMVLAWEYMKRPLRALPLFGVVVGLLAILGDLVFVLWAITPP